MGMGLIGRIGPKGPTHPPTHPPSQPKGMGEALARQTARGIHFGTAYPNKSDRTIPTAME